MSDFGTARVTVTLDARNVKRETEQLLAAISRQVAEVRVNADTRAIPPSIEAAVADANAQATITPDTTQVAPEIEGAVDAADTNVEVTGDATELTGEIDGSVEAADSHVVVTADATDVTGSIDGAVDAADTHIAVDVDSASLTAAAAASDDLATGLAGAAGGARLLAGGLAGIGLAAVAGKLYEAAQAASALEESTNKVNVVFGSGAPIIREFGETSATSVGLSEQAALEAAGTFGNLFTSLGTSKQAASAMSPAVVKLASDLASFNNIALDDALEKLRSGLVGEIEPLRTLGVSFNAAQVEAKAMELGLADANGQLSEGAKVQARWAVIQELSANAAGDFARTAEGLANQQRTLTAEVANARVEIGDQFLPLLLELVQVARVDLIPAAVELGRTLGPALVALVSASLPALGSGVRLLTSLTPAIEVLAKTIDLIPEPALATAAAFLFINRVLPTTIGLVGRLVPGLGGLGRVLGPGGAIVGGIFVLKTGLDALAESIGPDLEADTEKLVGGLERLGTSSSATGEAADLMGQDFGKLREAWRQLEDPGVVDSIGHVAEEFITLGGVLDQQFTDVERAKKLFGELDEGLAALAAQDPGRAFDAVSVAAQRLGVPVDELIRTKLPQYRQAIDASRSAADAAGTSVDKYGVAIETAGNRAQTAAGQEQTHADALIANRQALEGLRDAAPAAFDALRAIQLPGGVLTAEFVNLALAIDGAALSEEQLGAIADQLGVPLATLEENVSQVTGVVQGFVGSVEAAVPQIGQRLASLGEGVTFQGIRDEFAKTLTDITNFEQNIATLAAFPNVQAAAIQGGPQVAAALAQGFRDGKTDALAEMELQATGAALVQQRIIDAARDQYGPAFAKQLAALGLGGTQAFTGTFDLLTPTTTSADAAEDELRASGAGMHAAGAETGAQGRAGYAAGLNPVAADAATDMAAARNAIVAEKEPHRREGGATGKAGQSGYDTGLKPVDETARAFMAAARQRITNERDPHSREGRLTASAGQSAYAAALKPVDETARAYMAAARQRITNSKPGMSTAGKSSGGGAATGFRDGLAISQESINRQVDKWKSGLESGVRTRFEMRSPSKLMERYGALVAEGFVKGITINPAYMARIMARVGAVIGAAFGGVGRSVSFGGLQPAFAAQIQALIAMSGNTIRLISGWRSSAAQAALYADFLARGKAPPLVARPGTSKHEQGLAADLEGPYGLMSTLAHSLGLVAPVPGEPWHWQPGWTTGGRSLYERGAWETTNELARLHAGEMVLPARVAGAVRAFLTSSNPQPSGTRDVAISIRFGNVYGATETDMQALGQALVDPIEQALMGRKVRLAARVA